MRFIRLIVESFQAIQRAELEFGPQLNVLHGPNDLGKSTLVTAIRAALLVPVTSTEAAAYAPWYADATPRVTLTFLDDEGRYWRVRKAFGGSTAASAELDHSKDGVTFDPECKGREVDAKLRALLGWGIPAPGGKGAPRGLPKSFLANALLAAQSDVETLLEQSLASDDEISGKVRLSKALATLAQDPAVKRVLDAAQAEVDRFFTAGKGRRKTAQGSKFAEAAKRVSQLKEQLDDLERGLAESVGIEQNVTVLRERCAEARMREAEAQTRLDAERAGLQQTRARAEARARLDAARARLAEIDEFAGRVERAVVQLADAADHVDGLARALTRATEDVATAEKSEQQAAEALRRATSDEGAHERDLKRAQLAEQAASLAAKRVTLEARLGQIDVARAARAASVAAVGELEEARSKHVQLGAVVAGMTEQVRVAEQELEGARLLIAYGRLRDAEAAEEAARRAAESATANQREAAAREVEADALEARARTQRETLAARSARLPAAEQARMLSRLEGELKLAEAALGGGLSVALRPRAALTVRTRVDDQALDEGRLAEARVLEAERSVLLLVGDLVEIEVTAGAAEKRRAVDALRARWQTEALPILARATLGSVEEIEGALAALAREQADNADLGRRAEQLRAQAASARAQAALLDDQAANLGAGAADLEARRTAVGPVDLDALARRFAALGRPWEARAEAARTACEAELRRIEAELAQRQSDAALAAQRLGDAVRSCADRESAYATSLVSLGAPEPDALRVAIRGELEVLDREQVEIAASSHALVAEATGHVVAAEAAVAATVERARLAKEARSLAAAARDGARARQHALAGEIGVLRPQLDAMDRAAVSANVEARVRDLELTVGADDGSETAVATAEQELRHAARDLEEVKEELHKGEGALSRSGGPALRERVDEVRAAHEDACNKEKDLELEAEAWKLLLDTLRSVENEEGAHLGRALADPLGSRLAELTGGRYKTLRLDATLRTEAVDAAGAAAPGPAVLQALSLGTRAQLATLIRLALAEHLGCAVVLDDHLVHTDPTRLAWFRDALAKAATRAQIVVITCRPADYLAVADLPRDAVTHDLQGGSLRAIDVARTVKRWAVAPAPPSYPRDEQPTLRAPFTVLPEVAETERFRDALPVYDLAVAAGAFSASQSPRAIGWARVQSRGSLDRAMFAARITGSSMEPGVTNGAWVIFRSLPNGSAPAMAFDGRRVIVELRDGDDPEMGGQYTFKRLRVTRFDAEGDVDEVELRADNPTFASRRFNAESGEVRIVAEYVETVG